LFGGHAVLSTGRLVSWGDVFAQPPGFANQVFTRVRNGCWHYAAMTTSGDVLAWGDNSFGKANVPPLPPGVRYTDFDCTTQNTVLVRSDGQAIVCGAGGQGQTSVPALPPGVGYTAC